MVAEPYCPWPTIRKKDDLGKAPVKLLYPLALNLVVAGSLLAATAVTGRSRRWIVLSALPLLDAGLLAAYVFGEDTYRSGGISRWEAYRSPGGALGPMFVGSIAALGLCTALLLYSGLGDQPRLFRWSALAGGVCTLLLITPTIIGFGTN
jgi:hypothetical protein